MILVKLYCNMIMGYTHLCLPLASYGHHFLTSKRMKTLFSDEAFLLGHGTFQFSIVLYFCVYEMLK